MDRAQTTVSLILLRRHIGRTVTTGWRWLLGHKYKLLAAGWLAWSVYLMLGYAALDGPWFGLLLLCVVTIGPLLIGWMAGLEHSKSLSTTKSSTHKENTP